VLVRDFVAFTRDAHISSSARAGLDMSFTGVMSSIGINTDSREVGCQTDLPPSNAAAAAAALSGLEAALKTPATSR
jgi:hypothetical protein